MQRCMQPGSNGCLQLRERPSCLSLKATCVPRGPRRVHNLACGHEPRSSAVRARALVSIPLRLVQPLAHVRLSSLM